MFYVFEILRDSRSYFFPVKLLYWCLAFVHILNLYPVHLCVNTLIYSSLRSMVLGICSCVRRAPTKFRGARQTMSLRRWKQWAHKSQKPVRSVQCNVIFNTETSCVDCRRFDIGSEVIQDSLKFCRDMCNKKRILGEMFHFSRRRELVPFMRD